jgi:hypothetical protein
MFGQKEVKELNALLQRQHAKTEQNFLREL